MLRDVQDVSKTQTVSGQPVDDERISNSTVENTQTSVDANDGGNVSSAAASVDSNATDVSGDSATKLADGDGKGAEINLSPEALRQITNLSTTNRQLKKQL